MDVESLREASRALRTRDGEQGLALAKAAETDAWLRQQRLIFYRHAGIYAIVNAARDALVAREQATTRRRAGARDGSYGRQTRAACGRR